MLRAGQLPDGIELDVAFPLVGGGILLHPV